MKVKSSAFRQSNQILFKAPIKHWEGAGSNVSGLKGDFIDINKNDTWDTRSDYQCRDWR
jgi:hypothetical protein